MYMQKKVDILAKSLPLAVVVALTSGFLVFFTPLNGILEIIVDTLCIWGTTSWLIILAEDKKYLTDARHTLSLVIIAVVGVQVMIVLCVKPLLYYIF